MSLFTWKDYHAFALIALEDDNLANCREATLRSCVSRFYYGAFQTALNQGKTKGFLRQGASSDHAALRRHYVMRGKHDVARLLRALQGWREQCDYNDEVPSLETFAVDAKEAAEKIYGLLGVR